MPTKRRKVATTVYLRRDQAINLKAFVKGTDFCEAEMIRLALDDFFGRYPVMEPVSYISIKKRLKKFEEQK